MKYYYVHHDVQVKDTKGDWLNTPLVAFMVAGDVCSGYEHTGCCSPPPSQHYVYTTYEEAVLRAREADARQANDRFAHPVFEIERPERTGNNIKFNDIQVPLSASLEHVNPERYRRVDLPQVKLDFTEGVTIFWALFALKYYANNSHVRSASLMLNSFVLGAAIAIPLVAYVVFPIWVACAALLLFGLPGCNAYQNLKVALPSTIATDRERYYKKIVETIEDIYTIKSNFLIKKQIRDRLGALLDYAPSAGFNQQPSVPATVRQKHVRN